MAVNLMAENWSFTSFDVRKWATSSKRRMLKFLGSKMLTVPVA